jgi:hypothetical protein
MFRTALILVLFSLSLTAASTGQQGEHNVSAKVKERSLIQRAAKGDTRAQSEIIHKAEKGDPQAEAALGDNYEYGIWVPKDHAEALLWYRKAAEHGDIGAREILGQMYFDGKGVKQNLTEAARWFGCPKPSEAIIASCKTVSYKDLPQGARDLLTKMKCEVRTGSNYDYGSAVDLSGKGTPAYQFCCTESPHGPCGAVVVGKIGVDWKDLTAKVGSLGFDSLCGGIVGLESQHNGFHDVCIPDECSAVASGKGNACTPTIWQFSDGRYRSVTNAIGNQTQ